MKPIKNLLMCRLACLYLVALASCGGKEALQSIADDLPRLPETSEEAGQPDEVQGEDSENGSANSPASIMDGEWSGQRTLKVSIDTRTPSKLYLYVAYLSRNSSVSNTYVNYIWYNNVGLDIRAGVSARCPGRKLCLLRDGEVVGSINMQGANPQLILRSETLSSNRPSVKTMTLDWLDAQTVSVDFSETNPDWDIPQDYSELLSKY